ncbi:TIGR03759 family integrating conjugative element protein [Aquisalimonas lutea]|uniref:TIGR03759 family integrating conjugative element protein n=1 Tax=Aquisalimonas lutea TaxID=1327750 RepID=UPI0025B3BDC6|nr:TIGR03759 family integrating conjugative element protein [Aquisalimonas lutea]MDN3519062.1 TIGR03759 family integrating conjugative element protein [Aquisalimonas lutea]
MRTLALLALSTMIVLPGTTAAQGGEDVDSARAERARSEPRQARGSQVERSRARDTGPVDIERLRSSGQWNLDDEEWQRFETLMNGPRGLWTPNLDPVWVLGINARSDAERRRYAEMAVERERARAARELAFQRAYDQAWDRLYPDRKIVDVDPRDSGGQPASGNRPATHGGMQSVSFDAVGAGDRLVLVAGLDCRRCRRVLTRLVSALDNGAEWELDVFLLDAVADEEVRQWATALEIPPELVQSQRLTLNRDDGTLAAFEPPALLRRNGLRWQRVSL